VGDLAHVVVSPESLEAGQLLTLALARPPSPEPIDGSVARGRRDPRSGVVGDPVARPALQRRDERFLNGLFGQVEVTGHADQRRHRPPGLASEEAFDEVRGQCSGCSTIGRISIEPKLAPGILAAASIAWSRSSHSIRKYPPSCSFVSAKGPSVPSVSSPRTRTVVAVLVD